MQISQVDACLQGLNRVFLVFSQQMMQSKEFSSLPPTDERTNIFQKQEIPFLKPFDVDPLVFNSSGVPTSFFFFFRLPFITVTSTRNVAIRPGDVTYVTNLA
jgi:hypothetical protein